MPDSNDFADVIRRVGPDTWRSPAFTVEHPFGTFVGESLDAEAKKPGKTARIATSPAGSLAAEAKKVTEKPGIDIAQAVAGRDPHLPVLGVRPVTVLRTSDLLLVRVGFEGLEWVAEGERWALQRRKDARTAYLVVDFPPQHLVEEAFPLRANPGLARPPELPVGSPAPNPATPPNVDVGPTPPPVRALLSEHSRLSYVVTDETIPWSLDGLLTAMSTLPLSLARHAVYHPRLILELPHELVKRSATVKVQKRLHARDGRAVPGTVRAVSRSATLTRILDERLGRGASSAIGSASHVASAFGIRPQVAPGMQRDADFAKAVKKLARPVPRAPLPTETAIEIPWRLQLSPNATGAFAHAHLPVEHDDRVELWHSRLGQRATDDSGAPVVDEVASDTRTVRAIWARDMEGPLAPSEPDAMGTTDLPSWTKSLSTRDRQMIVDETSNFRLKRRKLPWSPPPATVRSLMLTSLGGWLSSDLNVPELPDGDYSVTEWKHRATMGRDHEVKVVYAGFLFPFGHRASLVKVTERQFSEPSATTGRIAYLRQRFYIVLREPTLTYPTPAAVMWDDQRSYVERKGRKRLDLAMPLSSVTVLTRVTPNLDEPTMTPGISDFCFVPRVDGVPFGFHLLGTDRENQIVEYAGPLMFVERTLNRSKPKVAAATRAYWDLPASQRRHPLRGQRVAFANATGPDGRLLDTTLSTDALEFDAAPFERPTEDDPQFWPVLRTADVVVPSMNALAGTSTPISMALPQKYLENGYAGNATHVFLQVAGSPAALSFTGQGDRSGGFVTPNLDVTALSGSKGPIGGTVDAAMSGTMDPTAFFAGLDAAKLFGAVKISDLLEDIGLTPANMPAFVADSVNEVTGLLADLQRLMDLAHALRSRGLSAAIGPVADLADPAAKAAAQAAIDTLKATVASVETTLEQVRSDAGAVLDAFARIDTLSGAAAALTTLAARLTSLTTGLEALVTQAGAVGLAGSATSVSVVPIALLKDAVEVVRRVADAIADADALVDKATLLLQGVTLPETVHAQLTWSTPLAPWPAGKALFQPRPAGGANPDLARGTLDLTVDVRAPVTASGDPSVTVVCSITPFSLRLLGEDPFIELRVETLEFTLLPGRKPDVNIVLADPGMVFGGPLSFVNTLQDLIPFAGFSDPPYLDVDSKGLRAGFDLALPDISIGVFSLANISLGAEAKVPFIGDSLDFTFSFCTRENPFRLTVWVFGGGGFFAISVTPDRCRMLEAAFEFGAAVSLDFGVASGSIECMAGVYFRLETSADGSDDGELTGYFRLRGEVDVLGLISASLELYLELAYEPPSGKAVGRASLTIEVEVLFLSTSVEITCEKKFTGSNADPTFAEVMGNPGLAVRPWDEYCDAFATV